MLGNAGQKISRIVDLAEELYERVVELREQVSQLRETTQETRDRVAALEDELAGQRVLLEAIAEAHDIDVEALRDGVEAESGTEPTDASPSTESGGPEPAAGRAEDR